MDRLYYLYIVFCGLIIAAQTSFVMILAFKDIRILYLILRYAQNFSIKHFIYSNICKMFLFLPLPLSLMKKLSDKIKFDNNIPVDYLNNNIYNSKITKISRTSLFIISLIYNTILFIYNDIGIFDFFMYYVKYIENVIMGYFGIMFCVTIILLIPFVIICIINFYRIIKYVKIKKTSHIFYIISLLFVLLIPFIGLSLYKNIIENRLKFSENFQTIGEKITQNRIIHYFFYSYGFCLVYILFNIFYLI